MNNLACLLGWRHKLFQIQQRILVRILRSRFRFPKRLSASFVRTGFKDDERHTPADVGVEPSDPPLPLLLPDDTGHVPPTEPEVMHVHTASVED